MSSPAGSKTKRPTIKDVAQLAGVSISTVSHAFSGVRPISEKTKERVREAALELNYRADPSAKSLRSSKAGIIGLILRPKDAISGTLRGTETFQRLLGAIATHALEQGKGLVHVPDVLDPHGVNVPMDVCIVAHPYYNDKVIKELVRRGIPIVIIDAEEDETRTPWIVNIGHELPVIEYLEKMRKDGRRKIAYISGTEDNNWNRLATTAYNEWCETNNVKANHYAIYEGAGGAAVAELVSEILEREDAPDAFITGPSTFAYAALGVIQSMGISVPEQIAIAALTDNEMTRSSTPTITSVDLNMEKAGALAVELAIQISNGDEPPAAPVLVAPEIKWRDSLAKN